MKINAEIKFESDDLPWEEICAIFPLAPLGKRDPMRLKIASENSFLVCTAWEGKKVIGFARVVSDQVYQAALYDLVLLPEYQGKGIGKKMLAAIKSKLPPQLTVILFAVPGKIEFYKKFGFDNLKTGMAIFADKESAQTNGLL